jgi:mono/diheme cytochrome c family protein
MASPTRHFLLGVAATLMILALAGALFIYSGAYPMGADRPHLPVTEKLIGTLRDRATQGAAASIVVPSLDDPSMIAQGAARYDALCTGCHEAPGTAETSLRVGLYPQPPNLVDVGIDNPGEAFWIIKHGIKMTAMPAWGKSYDDAQLWAIVAFLKRLPNATPTQYARWVTQGKESQAKH